MVRPLAMSPALYELHQEIEARGQVIAALENQLTASGQRGTELEAKVAELEGKVAELEKEKGDRVADDVARDLEATAAAQRDKAQGKVR